MNKEIFLIAEAGHNWNGDMERAKTLIRMAKEYKWSAVKFQLYRTDLIKKPHETNYDELLRSELNFDQTILLKEEADRVGIEIFFSCFDPERAYWATMIGVKRYKIASRSVKDNDLVSLILSRNKPVIISLGEYPLYEFPPIKRENVDFLFCVSRRKILREGLPILPEIFHKGEYSGFSDHCVGNEYAMMAMDRGATILEKHCTENKNFCGWDQCSSADARDMNELYQYKLFLEQEK